MPVPGRLQQVHHAAGIMHQMRHGGRVSLFNYNPSIAGGAIGRRFTKSALAPHRRRRTGAGVRGSWGDRQLASWTGAQGQGIAGRSGGAPSATRGSKESRKRVLAEMSSLFNKRHRA